MSCSPKLNLSQQDASPSYWCLVQLAHLCRYGIQATVDEPLWELTRTGKVHEGLKLCVLAAELHSTGAMSPLEVSDTSPPSVSLSLSYNSVRRAKWHSKLGHQKHRSFPISMTSVNALGGLIGRLDFYLWRSMPISYVVVSVATSVVAAISTPRLFGG
jgi:hypothetical protein